MHLAGVLADEAADARQRVVLANELDSVGVAAGLDEADVAGDVDVGRAAGDAGDLLGAVEAAAVVADVVFEVVAEAADGDEGHLAGLVADRAVARVIDRLGRALDEVKGVLIGAPLEDVL